MVEKIFPFKSSENKIYAKSRFFWNALHSNHNAFCCHTMYWTTTRMHCALVNYALKGKLSSAFFGKIQDIQHVQAGGNLFVVHDDNLSCECYDNNIIRLIRSTINISKHCKPESSFFNSKIWDSRSFSDLKPRPAAQFSHSEDLNCILQ